MSRSIAFRVLATRVLCTLFLSMFLLQSCKNTPSQESALPAMPDLMARASEATPSIEFKKAQAYVQQYRAKINEHPDQLENYVVLAEVYLQESRVTAKHHEYVPIAEHIIDAALQRNPKYFEAMSVKAGIDMTKHQFGAAKNLIEQAIAINPYNSGAYGVLCDANTELGLYDQAVVASDKMMNARPDLRSYARVSYQRELHGDRDGAVGAMKMAADAGTFGMENREWALYNLANLFYNMGKLDTAAYLYNGILEERPSYAFAMSGLAMVKAAKKDYPAAIELLVKASQTCPEHIFLEQLSDVYLAMGDKETSKQLEDKVFAAYDQHEKDGWNVDREYAAFALNHNRNIPEALTRAKRELDRRPENIDALETYSFALYKSGKASDAVPYIEKAMRLKTNNPTLHYHAGLIYAAMQNTAKAKEQLGLALAENSYLTVLTADSARTMLNQLNGVASK